MEKLLIYTLSTCPTCNKLKVHLNETGQKYEERVVDDNQQWMDEARQYGDVVPIIVHESGLVELGFANEVG